MKYTLLFSLFAMALALSPCAMKSQTTLDTVKVYNVYCTYHNGNSFSSWGGNWCPFDTAEQCPADSIQKYIDNYKMVSGYLDSGKFFWMKLYDTKERLIYEGLKYSDCTVGPFICYYPNGKVKMKGQYAGYSYSEKNGYELKKCSGTKSGVWEYYDEKGMLTEKENH